MSAPPPWAPQWSPCGGWGVLAAGEEVDGGDGDRAPHRPDHQGGRRVDAPGESGAEESPYGVVDVLLPVVHQLIGPVPAELVDPAKEDVAADPQHGGGAHDGDAGEQPGHRTDERVTDALR